MALQEKDRDFLTTPVGKTEFSIFPYFESLPPQVESKKALYNTQLWQVIDQNNYRIPCPSLSAPKCKPENRMNQWGEQPVGPNYSKKRFSSLS